MSRPVAFVAILALLWSHVAGLRCDMGGSAVAMAAGHADVATHTGTTPGGHFTTHAAEASPIHHAPPPTDAPPSPHPTNHGAPHGCLMIMACSIASPRPAHPAAMIRIPTVLVRAAFPAPPIPVAADLAVETPPPRHTV